MLSDLLQLEEYYGHPSCAAFFEDLSKRYGENALKKALMAGDICVKRLSCMNQHKRALIWLSPQGREKART